MDNYIPEAHTWIIEGKQRSGKTLFGVVMAHDAWKRGKPVFSNIELGFAHRPVRMRDLRVQDGRGPYWNGFVFLDEWNFLLDSRNAMKKENKEFTPFLFQQKKQGATLAGTTHDLQHMDVRLRNAYDYLAKPVVYPAYPHKPLVLKVVITNGPLQPPFRRTLKIPCERYLGMYNTAHTYDPFAAEAPDEEPPKTRPVPPQIRSRATL